MRRRAIPFVTVEAVVGECPVQLGHEAVPHHLGDDGRGRNGQAASISMNEGKLGRRRGAQAEGIEKQKVRPRHPRRDRQAKGE
jgi:hypothetical protein